MIGVYVYHTVVYIIMLRVLQYLLVLCTSLHTYHCQYYLDNISPLIPPTTWSYFVILLSNTHISRTNASMSKITKAPMLLGPQPCGYMLDHTRLLFWIEIYAHVKMGWKKFENHILFVSKTRNYDISTSIQPRCSYYMSFCSRCGGEHADILPHDLTSLPDMAHHFYDYHTNS